MKRYLLILVALSAAITIFAKKKLDHDSFDSWERPVNHGISNDGSWAFYAVEPQEGDATLYFYNTKTRKKIAIARGYRPFVSADSKWAVALIKPFFADTRQSKIDKKKGLDVPQDTLAIVNLSTGKVEKIPNVTGYKTGEKGGHWVAFSSTDTIYAKKKDLEAEDGGKPLVVRTFDGKINKVVNSVKDYTFSKNGERLAVKITKAKTDSITTPGIGVMLLPDTAFYLIDRDKKFYGTPVFNEAGTRVAYTAGMDSLESGTRQLSVYLASVANIMEKPVEYDVKFSSGNGRHIKRPAPYPELQGSKLAEWEQRRETASKDSLFINQYSTPQFSYNGDRLIIGVGRYIAPDDTAIVAFERPDLDIWRWDAPETPPQEKANLKKAVAKQYPVVIDIATGTYVLTASSPYQNVEAPDRWDGNWALVKDRGPQKVESQWNYLAPEELTLVNINDGEKRFIGIAQTENSLLSPADRFVAWYAEKNFYTYNIATGDTVCVTGNIPYPIWDEEDDHPMEKQPYGVTGWSKDDKWFFVNDRYDIWAVDPTGKEKPYCLTAGEGRKRGVRIKFRKTDPEQRFLEKGDLMLLEVFDYKTKEQGLATLKFEEKPARPEIKLLQGAAFTQIRKAKEKDVFSWEKASFEIMPDLWLAGSLNFSKAVQLTTANPQFKDYSWGSAHLFGWKTYSGLDAEGVLYLPEDFSPEKEYPMLAVFYEIATDDLYRHFTMEPSWSWVNYPFYVSRGYVVFVPDIRYKDGTPGECAYDYVCSGVEAVCREYPNIDKKRIGIDGQSWGGYQTAYLVTRTDMFACAGSGAPVANMTSAYGGIRWQTGDSRQAQYEQGQSRIGATLWEQPDLYIKNSPLFFADKIKTPLLIMHNDNDGAVPWYQGIELFMALRRLQKPVWMLQYNGEAHNIKERRNRKDITVRLQQFFDHYLMGDPMPRWMREGIPAVRKGQELGY